MDSVGDPSSFFAADADADADEDDGVLPNACLTSSGLMSRERGMKMMFGLMEDWMDEVNDIVLDDDEEEDDCLDDDKYPPSFSFSSSSSWILGLGLILNRCEESCKCPGTGSEPSSSHSVAYALNPAFFTLTFMVSYRRSRCSKASTE